MGRAFFCDFKVIQAEKTIKNTTRHDKNNEMVSVIHKKTNAAGSRKWIILGGLCLLFGVGQCACFFTKATRTARQNAARRKKSKAVTYTIVSNDVELTGAMKVRTDDIVGRDGIPMIDYSGKSEAKCEQRRRSSKLKANPFAAENTHFVWVVKAETVSKEHLRYIIPHGFCYKKGPHRGSIVLHPLDVKRFKKE